MEKIRKVFRNPASDLLFVLGLVISCIILINISDLASKIYIEENSQKEYTYTTRVLIGGSAGEEQARYITEYFDELGEGNIYLTKSVHIDKQRDGKYAYVLMEDNEELLFDFKDGGYDKSIDYENAIIIGESLEQYVSEDNGVKYMIIDNERYDVIGILENNMSAGIDTSLYILWDTVKEEIKDRWMKQDFAIVEIYYESNVSDSLFLEELAIDAYKYGIELEDMGEEKNITDYQNEVYKSTNKILLTIGLVFSVLTCFSVSYLWLMNRKKEMAIRMAYGYTNKQIFILLFKDTLYLLIPAFTIAVFAQSLYSLIIGNGGLFGEGLVLKLLIVFSGSLVIVLINTLYLMRSMRQFKAVMINEEK